MSGGVPKWGNKVAATGKLEVSGVAVLAREGLVIKNATMIAIKAYQDSEIVLVVSARSDSPQGRIDRRRTSVPLAGRSDCVSLLARSASCCSRIPATKASSSLPALLSARTAIGRGS